VPLYSNIFNKYLILVTLEKFCHIIYLSKIIHCVYTMNKIALAVVVTGIMIAVAVAPMMLSDALAVKTKKCENRGGHEKNCSSPAAKVQTCTAGNPPRPNHPNCAGT
jgi:hypothetical protein